MGMIPITLKRTVTLAFLVYDHAVAVGFAVQWLCIRVLSSILPSFLQVRYAAEPATLI